MMKWKKKVDNEEKSRLHFFENLVTTGNDFRLITSYSSWQRAPGTPKKPPTRKKFGSFKTKANKASALAKMKAKTLHKLILRTETSVPVKKANRTTSKFRGTSTTTGGFYNSQTRERLEKLDKTGNIDKHATLFSKLDFERTSMETDQDPLTLTNRGTQRGKVSYRDFFPPPQRSRTASTHRTSQYSQYTGIEPLSSRLGVPLKVSRAKMHKTIARSRLVQDDKLKKMFDVVRKFKMKTSIFLQKKKARLGPGFEALYKNLGDTERLRITIDSKGEDKGYEVLQERGARSPRAQKSAEHNKNTARTNLKKLQKKWGRMKSIITPSMHIKVTHDKASQKQKENCSKLISLIKDLKKLDVHDKEIYAHFEKVAGEDSPLLDYFFTGKNHRLRKVRLNGELLYKRSVGKPKKISEKNKKIDYRFPMTLEEFRYRAMADRLKYRRMIKEKREIDRKNKLEDLKGIGTKKLRRTLAVLLDTLEGAFERKKKEEVAEAVGVILEKDLKAEEHQRKLMFQKGPRMLSCMNREKAAGPFFTRKPTRKEDPLARKAGVGIYKDRGEFREDLASFWKAVDSLVHPVVLRHSHSIKELGSDDQGSA